jgi:hypothetical protein
MQTPPVADVALSGGALTSYDKEHLLTYLRLLDAHAEGIDWREVSRVVLHLDPDIECDRVRKAFDSHLSRAKWMREHGYRHLLGRGASA